MCWNALYFEILPCFNPPVQESNEVVVNIANGYKTIFATIPIVESCIAWSFQVLTCPPRAPLKFYVCFTFYLVVCPCLELTILLFLILLVRYIWSPWFEAHRLISRRLSARPSKLSISISMYIEGLYYPFHIVTFSLDEKYKMLTDLTLCYMFVEMR